MAFAAAGLAAAGLVAAVDPAVASTEQPIAVRCTEELAAGSAELDFDSASSAGLGRAAAELRSLWCDRCLIRMRSRSGRWVGGCSRRVRLDL